MARAARLDRRADRAGCAGRRTLGADRTRPRLPAARADPDAGLRTGGRRAGLRARLRWARQLWPWRVPWHWRLCLGGAAAPCGPGHACPALAVRARRQHGCAHRLPGRCRCRWHARVPDRHGQPAHAWCALHHDHTCVRADGLLPGRCDPRVRWHRRAHAACPSSPVRPAARRRSAALLACTRTPRRISSNCATNDGSAVRACVARRSPE